MTNSALDNITQWPNIHLSGDNQILESKQEFQQRLEEFRYVCLNFVNKYGNAKTCE